MEHERRRIYTLMKENSHLQSYEPQANFMLIKLRDENVSSTDFIDYLNKNRMIVRDGTEFLNLGKNI